MMMPQDSCVCSLVNVEARLKDDEPCSDDESALLMSDGTMPPIEIQFHNQESFSSPRADKQLLHLRSSNLSENEALEAENTLRSPSFFSIDEMFGGSPIASTLSNSALGPSDNAPVSNVSFLPSLVGLARGEPPRKEPDETSVMSTSFYDSSDFSPKYWSTVLTNREVMAGLAVIYVTVGLTHPVIFFISVLTALGLGTATAISTGYDLLEAPLGICLGKAKSNQVDAPHTIVSPAATQTENQSTQPVAESATGTLENEITPDQSREAIASADPSLDNQPELISTDRRSESNLNDKSSFRGITIPDDWLELHYPPLDEVICKKHEFHGLNVIQFFQVFLADDAPYHFKEFQKIRGDQNIEFGNWEAASTENAPLSMHCDAKTPFPQELDYFEFLTRRTSFLAKTNNGFLGPPYASTTKEHRLLLVNKRLGVWELKSTFADIPFFDRFYVMERWIITADKDVQGDYNCQISTSCQVFFVKSCPFDSQIRSRTKASVQDVTAAWCKMATEALKLAEQHKQERIRQQQRARLSLEKTEEVDENMDENNENVDENINQTDEEVDVDAALSVEVKLSDLDDATLGSDVESGQAPEPEVESVAAPTFLKRRILRRRATFANAGRKSFSSTGTSTGRRQPLSSLMARIALTPRRRTESISQTALNAPLC